MRQHGPSLLTRTVAGLGGLLAVALVTNVAWRLLAPTVPALGILIVLSGLVLFLLRSLRW